MISCQEALELLYDILDKEASEIDTQEVKEHLKKCGKCFEKYRLEESVQELLKNKLANKEKFNEKLNHIKSNIACQLDKIDAEEEKKGGEGTFFNLTKILVSTAALVVFVISGYLISHFVIHYKNYMPLEEAHWTADNNQANFYLADSGSQYFSKYADLYKYQLHNQIDGFNLVDAHQEKVAGVEMDHLIYKMDSDLVSIFLVPADIYSIPDDVKGNMLTKGDFEYFDHHCRGCRLLFHQVGNLVVVAATNNRELELTDFIHRPNSI